MRKGLLGFLIGLASVMIVVVIALSIFFYATPTGKKIINGYHEDLQKADDETLYEAKKQVEDTCRSMIASYKADKLMYEQYKDSDDKVLKSSAEQAKIRANRTATTYNEYILKNNYVWKNNIPADIFMNLPYIN